MKILKPEYTNSDARRKLVQVFTNSIEQANFYKVGRGEVLGDHYHKKTTEIFYIISGNFNVIVDGQEYRFKENDCFMVEPEEVHQIEARSSDSRFMTFLTIPFSKEKPDLWKK